LVCYFFPMAFCRKIPSYTLDVTTWDYK
jgi:hypothetical protein